MKTEVLNIVMKPSPIFTELYMFFYRTHTLTFTLYTLTCTLSKLTHYRAVSQGLFLTVLFWLASSASICSVDEQGELS
jgi:hypothetical protein